MFFVDVMLYICHFKILNYILFLKKVKLCIADYLRYEELVMKEVIIQSGFNVLPNRSRLPKPYAFLVRPRVG